MKATANSDVNPALLSLLRDELGDELALDENVGKVFLHSADPPSWIQFFADAQWWVKALGAYAALYIAELVKEAGKETWKERAKIAHSAVDATSRIIRLARWFVRLRSGLLARSELSLSLPVPDDYFGARSN